MIQIVIVMLLRELHMMKITAGKQPFGVVPLIPRKAFGKSTRAAIFCNLELSYLLSLGLSYQKLSLEAQADLAL